jgi:ectoine hydroxylase-related dioxygenase (phytanoyl-CoA dioxygenase family)
LPYAASHIRDAHRAQYDDYGYFVAQDLFTADEVASIRTETDRGEARARAALERLPQGRLLTAERGAITFAQHLVTRSSKLRALVRDSRMLGIVEDLIGPDVNLHWDQAVYKYSAIPRRFPWHQDNGYSFVVPQQYVTLWLALTDVDVGGGCLWVSPGLHKQGTLRHFHVPPHSKECFHDRASAVPLPVRAGSLLVFSSLTPHMSDANVTSVVRKAYIMQYTPMGARLLVGDPDEGPPTGTADIERQPWRFPVLRDGRALST